MANNRNWYYTHDGKLYFATEGEDGQILVYYYSLTGCYGLKHDWARGLKFADHDSPEFQKAMQVQYPGCVRLIHLGAIPVFYFEGGFQHKGEIHEVEKRVWCLNDPDLIRPEWSEGVAQGRQIAVEDTPVNAKLSSDVCSLLALFFGESSVDRSTRRFLGKKSD